VPSQRRLLAMPLGAMIEVLRKVRKAPRRKEARDTSVVVQACGLSGRPAVERPRITVFPGNVLDKAGGTTKKSARDWKDENDIKSKRGTLHAPILRQHQISSPQIARLYTPFTM
jgi:hypothetical protein